MRGDEIWRQISEAGQTERRGPITTTCNYCNDHNGTYIITTPSTDPLPVSGTQKRWKCERKDTKPLQSSNKRLVDLIKMLSGLIAYWSWSSRIKDSFGKHMTGVTEGENNQYWCGFGLFKGQLKSKCSVPRLPVDGCVRPRWQLSRHPNISDEISVETRHPFPAAASSFASGWNPNPDIVREIEEGLMRWRSH